jgi:hypothetical protein
LARGLARREMLHSVNLMTIVIFTPLERHFYRVTKGTRFVASSGVRGSIYLNLLDFISNEQEMSVILINGTDVAKP